MNMTKRKPAPAAPAPADEQTFDVQPGLTREQFERDLLTFMLHNTDDPFVASLLDDARRIIKATRSVEINAMWAYYAAEQ
jgi:hypothetical protein